MKGIIKENYFTADGALYEGDKVMIHTIYRRFYRVETPDGKLYTVPQDKIILDK